MIYYSVFIFLYIFQNVAEYYVDEMVADVEQNEGSEAYIHVREQNVNRRSWRLISIVVSIHRFKRTIFCTIICIADV